MKRTIIKINEELCDGCGACVTGCHEGALKIVNGKAIVVSESYCDGLGACIGECPQGAIALEEREAEPFDQKAVDEHLKAQQQSPLACGCPGSAEREIKRPAMAPAFPFSPAKTVQGSELRHFPVQLHLLNPGAAFLRGANLLLAADCTAFAYGDFHSRFLKDKVLAIACPKLDSNLQAYIGKLTEMIDIARIDTLTVLVMEVPCCGGLIKIAQAAREAAGRNIPVKVVVISVDGRINSEEWI